VNPVIHWQQLTPRQETLIAAIREAARATGCTPWLVGGAVRDLLLARPVGDLDVTIEGAAARFAAALAEIVGASLVHHERFLTYRLDVDASAPLDVVTARHEWYERPGALPSVAAGTIEEDLLRRDFAANAIALDLSNDRLFDPADGLYDLTARRLRILHAESFRDDPTRYFRGVRLARRLGFAFDDATGEAARGALRDGAMQTVSRERLWREIDLTLLEESAGPIIKEMDEAGALRSVVAIGKEIDPQTIDRAVKASSFLEVNPRAPLLALLGSPTDEELRHASLTERESQAVRWLGVEGSTFVARLTSSTRPLRRLAMLEKAHAVARAYVAAVAPPLLDDVRRASEIRRIAVPLDSTGVVIPAGKERLVGRAIRHARFAVAMEEIPPSEAPAFARARLIRYLRSSNVSE
jgi:tRNA nucleotidyltransferase/poly(A) polymerase